MSNLSSFHYQSEWDTFADSKKPHLIYLILESIPPFPAGLNHGLELNLFQCQLQFMVTTFPINQALKNIKLLFIN